MVQLHKWILALSVFGILLGGVTTDALANSTNSTLPAMIYCQGQINTQTAILAPIVNCFTDPTQGLIPSVTNTALQALLTYYYPAVQALCIMVVIFFGIQLVTGDMQGKEVRSEGFKILLKIGFVIYFLSQAPTIYTGVLTTIGSFAVLITQSTQSLQGSLFCSSSDLTNTSLLWGQWDCILGYLFGFSGGFDGAALKTMGIASFLLLMLFTKGSGTFIFSIAVALLMGLVFAAARFAHIYIISILAFSFVYLFGYMFVPMVLFKATQDRFEKWLEICIGYILTPIVVLGFMAMMLVAVDMAVFSSPYSIMHRIAGTAAPTTADGTNNIFTTLVLPTSTTPNACGGLNNNTCSCLKSLLFVGHNNSVTGTSDSTVTDPCADTTATVNNNLADPAGSRDSGVFGGGSASAGGAFNSLGILGTQFMAQHYMDMYPVGVNVQALNINALASAAGGTTASDSGQYVTNILTSFISALLLAFVMYSLLSYLPFLAADLSAQGANNSMISHVTKVAGEDLLRGASPGPGKGLGGAFAKEIGQLINNAAGRN